MIDYKTIEQIKPTPIFKSKRCIYISKALQYFLQYSNYIFALIIYFSFDIAFAVGAFFFGILLMGIIRSKLRNSSIPPKQREFQYSDKEIAQWFLSEYYCFET